MRRFARAGVVFGFVPIGAAVLASSPNPCGGLSDATPSSGARCHCDRLNLIGLPEPGTHAALLCGALGIAGLARARRQPRRLGDGRF